MSHLHTVFAVLLAASTVLAQTHYRAGPSATDAERIATEMQNDVVSGRFRPTNFASPGSAAFDSWRADIEENERARIEEALRYADRITAEYEERTRYERERLEAEEARRRKELEDLLYEERRRAWEAERARMDVVVGEYLAGDDGVRALEGALRSQTGNLEGYAYGYQGRYEKEDVEERLFVRAAILGEVLGLLGMASLTVKDEPSFGQVFARALATGDASDRLRRLTEPAQAGNLAARLLLGAWCTGRDVGLGVPPGTTLEGGSVRALGLETLRLAAQRHPVGHALMLGALAEAPEAETEFYDAARALDQAAFDERGDRVRQLYRFEIARAFQRRKGRASSTQWQNAIDEKSPGFTPAAARAYGIALLEGGVDYCPPSEAARVLRDLPDHPAWQHGRALGLLAHAYDGEFDRRNPLEPRALLSRFTAAVAEFERLRSGRASRGKPEDLELGDHDLDAREGIHEHDAKLWLLVARARFAGTEKRRVEAARMLDQRIARGDTWARVLRAYARLHDAGLDQDGARAAWRELDGLGVFERRHSPPRLLALQACVTRLVAHGVLDGSLLVELERYRFEPVDAGAFLARHTFVEGSGCDASQPRNLAPVFAAILEGASRGTSRDYTCAGQWRHAAALIEVMQPDPLDPETWDRTWLAEFRRKTEEQDSPFGYEPRTWWQLLREPTREKLAAVETREAPYLGRSDAHHVDVQVLLASVGLRVADTSDRANAAVERLIELGCRPSWHAQALLTSFERRYREYYLARDDLTGFHRDAARVAEVLAMWRSLGAPFLPRDPDAAARALVAAILHGSTAVTRADLEALREDAPEAVRDGLRILDEAASGVLSPAEIDELEQQSYLLRRDIELRGRRLLDYSTRERVVAMAAAIHGARGLDAALRYLENQRARYAHVDWDVGELYADGADWLESDRSAALECFRRAHERAPGSATPRQLFLFVAVTGEVGDAADLERAYTELRDPAHVRRILQRLDGHVLGEAVLGVARRFEAAGDPAHAFDMQRLSVALGCNDALRACEARDDLSPQQCLELGRAVIECSTLNATVAIPWLERARAGDAAGAAADLAEWQDASGAPTWRLRLAYTLRGDRYDPDELARSSTEDDPHPERTAVIRRAASGAPEALEIATRVYGIDPFLIEHRPATWDSKLRRMLLDQDAPRLLEFLLRAPSAVAELEHVEGRDSAARAELVEAIGLGTCWLARLPEPPSGVQPAEFDAGVTSLLEWALREEWTDAYVVLLERAASGGDPALVASTERILDLDRANAPLLESTLAPRLSDRAAFDALFRARGLYLPGGVEPTVVLQLFQEHGRRVALDRCVDGVIVAVEARLPGLYGPHPEWKPGALGEILSRLRYTNWALPLLAFEELGVRPEDADDLRAE